MFFGETHQSAARDRSSLEKAGVQNEMKKKKPTAVAEQRGGQPGTLILSFPQHPSVSPSTYLLVRICL